jgi:pimeloyl-ACP methyl ester carboxylesterase
MPTKKKESPPVKGEIVTFSTPDKILLHGFLSRPIRRSSDIVIHLHGLQGDFYGSSAISALAVAFPKAGFNFLSIEQRGSYVVNDKRKGRGRTSKIIMVGGALEKFEGCVHDIEGAIRFARKLGMKKIYLEGHSTGCQKTSYYLGKINNRFVKGLILIAPDDDYNITRNDLGKKFKEAVAFAKKHKNEGDLMMPSKYLRGMTGVSRFLSYSDPKNAESKIFNYDLKRLYLFNKIKQPVLVIFGTKDEYIMKPAKEYLKMLEENSGTGMFDGVLIKGANHGFRKHEEELILAIVKWLKVR